MSSLRARVLASVLVLAAAGMIALGAVTYAEQHSFLESRVDQQARSAVGALSQVLDNAGFRPPTIESQSSGAGGQSSTGSQGASTGGQSSGAAGAGNPAAQGNGSPGDNRDHGGPGGPAGHSALVSLPPGTYGQRRLASGRVIGSKQIKYSATETLPATPRIPASVPLNTLMTVGSHGSSGLHYRLYAQRDPEDSGITVAAVPLGEVESTLNRLLIVELIVIGSVLAALGLSAWFVVKLGLRPLDRIERDADQIAAGTMSRRVSPATPKTEVGRLGLALNAMLDRLEQAFRARTASEERLRQFLADASHELRTPLASIRGYAELFRMGATQSPGETETAMRRIEEESKRMGVLVEDLLTLARLDEQREREREPVDLAALARDAVQDALATAPDREISLHSTGASVVSGDTLQLRQVFANLLRNALVHTPAGTPVEVELTPGESWVELAVRDHGPGIPVEARERLFERFWRREGGRERGKAGAGLGLAIVHGIVSAHHGEITVADTPGGGASFLVRLPVSPR